MNQQVDVRAVESILYGIYKATYNTMGESSASLMRRVAPEIFSMIEKLGGDFSSIDDLDSLEKKISETLNELGMCEKITFKQKDDLLIADVTKNAFCQLTKRLKDEGIPLFGCPFAAVTIAIAERVLKKKARLKTLEPAADGESNTHVVVQLS